MPKQMYSTKIFTIFHCCIWKILQRIKSIENIRYAHLWILQATKKRERNEHISQSFPMRIFCYIRDDTWNSINLPVA